jgi:hypothetical protein
LRDITLRKKRHTNPCPKDLARVVAGQRSL